MMPILLIVAVIWFVRYNQSIARRKETERAAAAKRAQVWDAASESERQAILQAFKTQQQKEASARLARSKTVKQRWGWFLAAVVALAVLVALVIFITAIDAWHFVWLCVAIGWVLWILHSVISDAVADGIRKGKQS